MGGGSSRRGFLWDTVGTYGPGSSHEGGQESGYLIPRKCALAGDMAATNSGGRGTEGSTSKYLGGAQLGGV